MAIVTSSAIVLIISHFIMLAIGAGPAVFMAVDALEHRIIGRIDVAVRAR